jgi:hypothetical protein
MKSNIICYEDTSLRKVRISFLSRSVLVLLYAYDTLRNHQDNFLFLKSHTFRGCANLLPLVLLFTKSVRTVSHCPCRPCDCSFHISGKSFGILCFIVDRSTLWTTLSWESFYSEHYFLLFCGVSNVRELLLIFVFTLGKDIELLCTLRTDTQIATLWNWIGWAGYLLTSLNIVVEPVHSFTSGGSPRWWQPVDKAWFNRQWVADMNTKHSVGGTEYFTVGSRPVLEMFFLCYGLQHSSESS